MYDLMQNHSSSLVQRMRLFLISYSVSFRNWHRKFSSARDSYPSEAGQRYDVVPSDYFQFRASSILDSERLQVDLLPDRASRAEARAKLRSLLKMEQLNCKVIAVGEICEKDGFLIERTYLSFGPKQQCPIDIITYDQFKEKPKPLIICMQGYNSGAHLSLGRIIEPYDVYKVASGSSIALDAARLGFRVISYERPCFGERRETKLHKPIPNPTIDASFSALMVGETLLGQTISEVSSLITWANQRFGCLKLGTYISGYSAAGITAIFASAVDERIDGIAVGGCIGQFRDTVMKRGTNGYLAIPDLLKFFEFDVIMGLIAPRIFVAISGTDDHIFPFRGAEQCFVSARRMFRCQGAESAVSHIQGDRGHTYYPEKLWPTFVDTIKHRSDFTGKSI